MSPVVEVTMSARLIIGLLVMVISGSLVFGCNDGGVSTVSDGDEETLEQESDLDSDVFENEQMDSEKSEEEITEEADAAEMDSTENQEMEAEDDNSETDEFVEDETNPLCTAEEMQQECSFPEDFDYSCDMNNAEATCPGGICALGLCIGPVLDEDRWDFCGNGCCGTCEDETSCPADCVEDDFVADKDYDNQTTISVDVHGWSNTNHSEKQYGYDRGCGGMLENMANFGVNRPCSGDAPNQLVKLEYFGDSPADWLSEQDIEEIEQYPLYTEKTLHRYALITAKFIRHKLEISGATHVNLICHSYGCLISRYMIENNIDNLAAENRFVRWFTASGVLAGARLARLYDNETVQEIADLIGLSQTDFVVMNPDFVKDNAARWDHKIYQANNPYFKNMIIHHASACDPRIEQALNIKLLDLNNPGDEPNDGIMFSFDTFFHDQKESNRFEAKNGELLKPTLTYEYVDHMAIPDTDASTVLATATLFHKRKVFITISKMQLVDDFEGNLGNGSAPAEIILESKVRYNPYILENFNKDVLVHNSQYEYRTPDMLKMYEGETIYPDLTVFEAPVFDEMQHLYLDMELLEVDEYNRMNVHELPLGLGDPHDALISYSGQIELADGIVPIENENIRLELQIKMVDLY